MNRRFKSIAFSMFVMIPFFFNSTFADAKDITLIVDSGNLAFAEGDFAKALAQYNLVLNSGIENGYIYYNIANTHFRLGEIGKSIAAFRRARALMPRDPDILANLALVRGKVNGKLDNPSLDVHTLGSSLLLSVLDPFSRNEILVASLLAYVLFWIILCWSQWKVFPGNKLILGVFFLCWVYGFFVLSFSRPGPTGDLVLAFTSSEKLLRPGVVIARESAVRSGYADSFQVISVLTEGLEVEVGVEREGWIEILLQDRSRGWVNKSELEIL